MTKIELTSTSDITLKTAGKYCEEDIQIKQNLERRSFTPSGEQAILYPSDGHNGISEIVVYKNPTEKVIVQSSETKQTITPSEGKFIDEVEVQPIPEGYIIPSGNIDITENQVVDVTQYSQATISVPTGGGGEDLIGSMMMGIPVDYVDTQRSVISVVSSAFLGLNNQLNSIELPVCVNIGNYAFKNNELSFNQISDYYNGLRKVSLPECVEIPIDCFYLCVNLSELYVPKVKKIKSRGFYGARNLEGLNLPEVSEIEFSAFYSCNKLSFLSAPNLQSIGGYAFYSCSFSELNLPELTYVSNYAFQSNSSLVNFNAPKLSVLANGLFASCYKLANISIDYDNLSQVASSCFSGCRALSNFSASNCFVINSSAFYGCSTLESVSLPVCSSIGQTAFQFCYNLQEANFPECTFLASYAFYTCSSLTKAYFPKLNSAVNKSCFMSCSSLTNVSLPLCTSIFGGAFSGCITLPSLNLPSVNIIDVNVFANCYALSALILGSTSVARLTNSNAFANTPMKSSSYLGYFGSIYVPADLVDSYKSATNWTYFSDRITSIDNLPTV